MRSAATGARCRFILIDYCPEKAAYTIGQVADPGILSPSPGYEKVFVKTNPEKQLTLGWREWVSLPELGLPQIKAKIDTGARTSALHAFELRDFDDGGVHRVEFMMHPNQRDTETVVTCVADIIDQRIVRDSGGHEEQRYVIKTPVCIGRHVWPIELTLTARDDMLFRMLLGRTALKKRAIVNPSRSYLVGKRRTAGK